jgi:hypothetical protein
LFRAILFGFFCLASHCLMGGCAKKLRAALFLHSCSSKCFSYLFSYPKWSQLECAECIGLAFLAAMALTCFHDAFCL